MEYVAAKAGFTTLASPTGSDYGIDIVLNTFDEKGYVENETVKIQVKARETLKRLRRQDAFSLRIRKEDLSHWLLELSPVILVLFDGRLSTSSETQFNMLNGTIPFSAFRQLLTRLGSVESRIKGSHIDFHHQPTETLLVAPHGTKRITAQRLASVRQIVTGRGVTSEERFGSLLDTICGQKA